MVIRQRLIPSIEETRMSFLLSLDTIIMATNEEIKSVRATMIEARLGSTEVCDNCNK